MAAEISSQPAAVSLQEIIFCHDIIHPSQVIEHLYFCDRIIFTGLVRN
jgi:hypothetical protein